MSNGFERSYIYSHNGYGNLTMSASVSERFAYMLLKSSHTICLQSDAFYALIDSVVEHIDNKFNLSKQNQWIDGEETMKLLNIGRVTLQKYRDEGRIRFSQHDRKNILYDRNSILEFIESHAKEKF